MILDTPVIRIRATGNAIEPLNAPMRKVAKMRRLIPTDESAMKNLHLSLHKISKKLTMPIRDGKQAMEYLKKEDHEM